MKSELTQAQATEMATTIAKIFKERYESLTGHAMSPEELDVMVDGVSRGVVKGLQDAGVELNWINRIRKN